MADEAGRQPAAWSGGGPGSDVLEAELAPGQLLAVLCSGDHHLPQLLDRPRWMGSASTRAPPPVVPRRKSVALWTPTAIWSWPATAAVVISVTPNR